MATRPALLSNPGPDFGSYFRHGPFGRFFAAFYVSGELGLLKPHPKIYQHVLDDLGISAAQAVFTDNRKANVRGAQAPNSSSSWPGHLGPGSSHRPRPTAPTGIVNGPLGPTDPYVAKSAMRHPSRA